MNNTTLKQKKGSGLFTYSIIIGVIAILSLFALQSTGSKTYNIFSNTLNSIETTLNPGPKIGETRPIVIRDGQKTETWNGEDWELTETTCHSGYHNENNICILNTRIISILNGEGTEIWNGTDWDLSSVNCDYEYHEENLACISNTRTVPISNGSQTQNWSESQWNIASVSCNSGYTQSGNNCVANTGTWSVERTGTNIPSGSSTCSNNKIPSGTCSPIGSVCYTTKLITPTPPTWLNHKATCK